MSVLIADSITLSYGTKKVLSDIYVRLETGFVTGILGRNGTGKSTLMKIIFGTLQGDSQSIQLDEKRGICPYMEDGLISFLPQEDFIPGHVKTKTALGVYGIDVNQLCDDFPVFSQLLEEKIKNLSGGERRLLQVYMVLKRNVKFVLLDEPFSYLMPLYVQKLKEIIKREKVNKGIVITDHMYHDVDELSDVLYLINERKSYSIESKEQLVTLGYLNKV